MKQLWIFLICICCTLTVLGQHQNTDSTPTKKSTSTRSGAGDTGRAGQAVPAQKQSSTNTQTKDTGKASKVSTAKPVADTGVKQSRKRTLANATDSSKSGSATTAASDSGNANNRPKPLTAQQLEAQHKASEQRQLKERKDSIYNTHKRQVLSELTSNALTRDNRRPDYSIFFPDYFYDNSHNAGNNNGALVSFHAYRNRDLLFYAFFGITLLLALIKMIFPRYFNQIFWFFLHPNDRKNNPSEQISGQNVLPSLLLNLFFVLTGGLFLAQIARPNIPGTNFWTTWALFSLLLTGVYLVKFLVILLSGWVFGAPTAATIYNQVVFSINKIIGLLLLPATLLISYGTDSTLGHVFSTVVVIIVILLIYRYIASFLLIKGKLKVSAFHFILYLCAVEIVPLLLVYKVLLTNMGRFM